MKIHNLFYLSLLEQNSIRKGQANKFNNELPKREIEFGAGDNKEHEVQAIIDSAVYEQEKNGQIPGFYYLVLLKSYPEEGDIYELS